MSLSFLKAKRKQLTKSGNYGESSEEKKQTTNTKKEAKSNDFAGSNREKFRNKVF